MKGGESRLSKYSGGLKNLRKKAGIVGSCLIIIIIGLVTCGVQKNNGTTIDKVQNQQSAGNEKIEHLSMEIVENVEIDADIENSEVEKCIVYKTTGKEFDIDRIKKVLCNDITDLTEEVDEKKASVEIEDTEGGNLCASPDRLDYEAKDGMADLMILVKYCYWDKIDKTDAAQAQEFLEEATVKNAVEKLNEIYSLEDEQEFYLQKAVKISMTDIIKKRKKMTGDIVTEAETREFTKDFLTKDAYFLSFTVKNKGIPMASNREPELQTGKESSDIQITNVEVIADKKGLEYLSIQGAFELEEDREENIITAQEAVQYIKSKYDNQVIEEKRTFDKIWLEYIFVSETSIEDYKKGTLEPYWIFVDSKNDAAERINAITGDNFGYE